MVKKSLICLVLLLQIISCGSRNVSEYKTLTEFEEIHLGDSIYLKYPTRIYIYDSLALVLDQHAPQGHFLHLFTYPRFEYRKSLLREGRGEGEFNSVSSFDVRDDSLYVLNMTTKVLFGFSLRDLMERDEPVPSLTNYDIGVLPVLNFRKTADGIVFIENGKYRKLYKVGSDENGEFAETLLHSPEPNVPAMYNVSLWNSFLAYDEKNDAAAVVTQSGELLEIVNEGKVIEIVGKDGIPRVLEGGVITQTCGYFDVKIYDDHIFALYMEPDKRKVKGSTKPESSIAGANTLRIYDLNGNLVACFRLAHYATGFDLDIDNNKLIFIDVNTEFPIVIYDASPVLKSISAKR